MLLRRDGTNDSVIVGMLFAIALLAFVLEFETFCDLFFRGCLGREFVDILFVAVTDVVVVVVVFGDDEATVSDFTTLAAFIRGLG